MRLRAGLRLLLVSTLIAVSSYGQRQHGRDILTDKALSELQRADLIFEAHVFADNDEYIAFTLDGTRVHKSEILTDVNCTVSMEDDKKHTARVQLDIAEKLKGISGKKYTGYFKHGLAGIKVVQGMCWGTKRSAGMELEYRSLLEDAEPEWNTSPQNMRAIFKKIYDGREPTSVDVDDGVPPSKRESKKPQETH
jgi:hypothetical protein